MNIKTVQSNPLISLDEAKMHLRRLDDSMDDLIVGCLYAATSRAENITGQHFCDNTVEISGIAEELISTECYPIRQVVSAKVDGVAVDVADFTVTGSRIANPYPGQSVKLTLETGYCELPFDVRAAILLITGKYVEHPIDGRESLPNASDNILKAYRRWNR